MCVTAYAISGKVGIPLTGLKRNSSMDVATKTTRQVGPQLLCNMFLMSPLCCHFAFLMFCWYRGLCHMTESDLFLFPLLVNLISKDVEISKQSDKNALLSFIKIISLNVHTFFNAPFSVTVFLTHSCTIFKTFADVMLI